MRCYGISLILCDNLVYDLGVVQKVIYDLEKNHIRVKQQYGRVVHKHIFTVTLGMKMKLDG